MLWSQVALLAGMIIMATLAVSAVFITRRYLDRAETYAFQAQSVWIEVGKLRERSYRVFANLAIKQNTMNPEQVKEFANAIGEIIGNS